MTKDLTPKFLGQDSQHSVTNKTLSVSFYIVTVNNPTCTILSNNRKKELVDIVTQLSYKVGRKTPIFFDNAYSDLVHDSTVETLESAQCYDELGIVYEIGTLSKILAPGLRIGYLIGPKWPLPK